MSSGLATLDCAALMGGYWLVGDLGDLEGAS